MTDTVDVEKLAELARIAITDEECLTLKEEISAILSFVQAIQEAGGEVRKDVGEHYNVFRSDAEPHEGNAYSDALIAAMPQSDGRYLKVRKIL